MYTINTHRDLKIGTPLGGLLYFEAGQGAKSLTVTCDGVVEAPYFTAERAELWR